MSNKHVADRIGAGTKFCAYSIGTCELLLRSEECFERPRDPAQLGKRLGIVRPRFFVGRKLSDPNQLIVYGKGEKMVTVPPKYFTGCYAAAPILKSHRLNLVMLGEQYVSGAKQEGWIVCASDSRNRVLAAKASSEFLLNLFYDDSRFSKLLSAK